MHRSLILFMVTCFFASCQDEIVVGDVNQKAIEYGKRKHYDSAIYYANKNLEGNFFTKDQYLSHYIIASIHERRKEYKQASSHYIQSLQKLPEDDIYDSKRYEMLYNIGRLCHLYSNFTYAIYYYKKASKYCPSKEKWRLQFNLGISYKNQGELEKATYTLSESLRLALFSEDRVRQAKVYNELGLLYSSVGDFERSRSKYRTITNYDGEFPKGYKKQLGRALHNLGNSYLLETNYEKAISYLEEALNYKKSGKELFVTYLDLGKCYEAMNQEQLAFEFFQKASTYYDKVEPNLEFIKVFKYLDFSYRRNQLFDKSELVANKYYSEMESFVYNKEQQADLFASADMEGTINLVTLSYHYIHKIKKYQYSIYGMLLGVLLIVYFGYKQTIKMIQLRRERKALDQNNRENIEKLDQALLRNTIG